MILGTGGRCAEWDGLDTDHVGFIATFRKGNSVRVASIDTT